MSAGKRSRAAAVALLAGGVMVLAAAIVVPAALYWSKTGAEYRAAQATVLAAKDREDAQVVLSQTRQSWNAFVGMPDAGFSQAPSDEDAIADAKARIEAAFEGQGGRAETVEGEADASGREGVRRIGIEVRGTISRAGLGPLLGALESEPPFLIVRRFEAKADAGNRLRVSIGGAFFRLAEDGS